jgi:UDP-N-acetylmuramoyl-L-alanyl-D-glutamate--2,6-diaminopimelate ligase
MNVTSQHSSVRNLAALLGGLAENVPSTTQIRGLTLDSRAVQPGWAFVAVQGLRTHGLAFVNDAIAAGAASVLWEPAANITLPALPPGIVAICVPDLTRKLGIIADRFFDSPSQSLRIAAVTGTNGKTTTAYMLAAALEQVGTEAAYTGTLGYGRVAAVRFRPHTTPDCISVHRELAELRDGGVRSVGMEVTSHALDQHRVAGVRFDTAVFTNLTRDHLDYHGTLEAYGAAKALLFEWPDLKHAVVNVEDTFGRELAARDLAAPLTVYGRENSARSFAQSRSDVRYVCAQRFTSKPLGLDIEIDSSWGHARLHSRLIGTFNVDNVLAVLATLLGFGIPFDDALQAVERGSAPPGRMEMLTAPGKPLVLVDYAHTPDALAKALQATRQHCTGRIWCVFGCGGERDRGKRPLMGAIAEADADAVIVTDDNPRGEDGDAIVAGILGGMQHPQRAHVERDRAAAIEYAIARAGADDVVLVAGKGHEDYQIVGTTTRHFSDRDVATAALRRRT